MDCCENLFEATQRVDFYLLLITGLTISLGHCIGMCGPLVTAFALGQRKVTDSRWRLTINFLTYHIGRLMSYTLIGALMGLIGSTVFLADEGVKIQGTLSILIGFLILLMTVGIAGWSPVSRFVEQSPLKSFVSRRLAGLLSASSVPRRFGLGVANGFLPCGPVFSVAMIAAAAGSFWRGGLAMLVFGIGTVPVLVVLGLGVERLSAKARVIFTRIGALFMLFIAVQLLLRGLSAWKVVGHLKFGEFVVW
jgi:uncharacterized protein